MFVLRHFNFFSITRHSNVDHDCVNDVHDDRVYFKYYCSGEHTDFL